MCLLSFSGKSPKYSKTINNNLVLGQKNNQDYGIDLNGVKYCTDDFINNYPEELYLKKNDVLLNTLGGGTVGRSGIFNLEDNQYITDGHLFVFRNINEILSHYLLYYLKLNRIQIEKNADGSTNQTFLKLDNVKKYLISLPPLKEQNRIKMKIDLLNPIIDLYNEKYNQIELLNNSYKDELKKSILQYAIQGKLVKQDSNDEPAEVLINKILDEKRELIKTKQIKKENLTVIYKDSTDNQFYEKFDDGKVVNVTDEIPFEIPDSWRWLRLRNIVYNHGQKKPSIKFSYIDIGSIDNKNHKLSENENIILPQNAPSRARKIIKEGDIIYSTVRPYLHNMCIIDKSFSCEPIASTGFAVIHCIEGINNMFLFYYLLSPIFDTYANSNENAKGVAYPAINDERLYKAIIPIPSSNEQSNIVDKIEELFNVL